MQSDVAVRLLELWRARRLWQMAMWSVERK